MYTVIPQYSVFTRLVPESQQITRSMDAQVPQIKCCSVVNPLRHGFSIRRFRCKTHRYRGWLHICGVYVYVCVCTHTHTHTHTHILCAMNLGEPWTSDWFHFPFLLTGSTSSSHCLSNRRSTMAFRFPLSIKIILTSYLASSLQAGIRCCFSQTYIKPAVLYLLCQDFHTFY